MVIAPPTFPDSADFAVGTVCRRIVYDIGQENQSMLSKETLERYRRMTTSERAAIVVQSMRENWPAMFAGSDETVTKRFELLRRQNDERNRNILEGLARTRTDAS